MKKTLIVLSLLAALSINACDKKEEAVAGKDAVVVPAGAQALLDKTAFTEEALLGMFADKKAVTEIEYEAMLLGVEKCDVNEEKLELDYNCPALKALRTFQNSTTEKVKDYIVADGVKIEDIKAKYMKSDKHKLQAYLIPQTSTFFGVKEDSKNSMLDIEKAANSPLVTKAVINTLSNEMKTKVVGDFILSRVDDKVPAVRSAVAIAVTSSWSKEVEGIIPVAIKFLDDEDESIRKIACSRIGGLASDQVIEPIVAILKDGGQEYRHGDCLRSLYTLWYDYPFHEKTSEPAYKATIAYLGQTPRTDNLPPWTSVGELRAINKDRIEAWQKKATYFKANEYVALMVGIAADEKANWLGRTGAVDVIKAWGTKKDLEDLKVKMEADTTMNAVHVRNSITKAIEEMPVK